MLIRIITQEMYKMDNNFINPLNFPSYKHYIDHLLENLTTGEACLEHLKNLQTVLTTNDYKIISNESNNEDSIAEYINLNLKTLHDSPEVNALLSNSNILFVDNYKELNESNLCNTCITSTIDFLGRKLLMNICNEGEKNIVYMNITANNKDIYNIPFELKERNSSNSLLHIDRSIL